MTDHAHGELAALKGVRSHIEARIKQVKADESDYIGLKKMARLDELTTLLEALDAVIAEKEGK